MKSVPRASFAGSVCLAFLAGFVDAVGFILSGGLFVSFMSGNSTQGGVEFLNGQPLEGLLALALVSAFFLGVVAAQASKHLFPRLGLPQRILGLGFALAVASALVMRWPQPGVSLMAVAAVMGATNTLFVSGGRARVAITYATGTLVSLGIAVADRAVGGAPTPWKRPLALWAAITVGAGVGTFAWTVAGAAALLIAAVGLLLIGGLLAIAASVAKHR
ncbi:YoaK family protein [Galactobacter valiniphilus]|uniref:YoaK family protein n=1 Tax=Galactobacter valiniphilus TaxID=2676122 RepID=UPI0037363EFE